MEKFSGKEYRDNLAKNIKDVRKTDFELAKILLEEAKKTDLYNFAKQERYPLTDSIESSINGVVNNFLNKIENSSLNEVERRQAKHVLDLFVEDINQIKKYIPIGSTYVNGKSNVHFGHFKLLSILENLDVDLSSLVDNTHYKYSFVNNSDNTKSQQVSWREGIDSASEEIASLEQALEEKIKGASEDGSGQIKFELPDSEIEFLNKHVEVLEEVNQKYVNNSNFKLESVKGGEEIGNIYPNEYSYQNEYSKKIRMELLNKLTAGYITEKNTESDRILREISKELENHVKYGLEQGSDYATLYTNDVNLYCKALFEDAEIYQNEKLDNGIKSLFKYSWGERGSDHNYEGNSFVSRFKYENIHPEWPIFNRLGKVEKTRKKIELLKLLNKDDLISGENINEIVNEFGGMQSIFDMIGVDILKLRNIKNFEFQEELKDFISSISLSQKYNSNDERNRNTVSGAILGELAKPHEDIDLDYLDDFRKNNNLNIFWIDGHFFKSTGEEVLMKKKILLEKEALERMIK